MSHRKTKTLFFAGTDTDVGKTYVAALAAQHFCELGLRVGVYKPVASGCCEQDGHRIAPDAVLLWEAAGQPRSMDEVCPQKFIAPLAPPEAAAAENRLVDWVGMTQGIAPWVTDEFDITIVEGAGGLMSPMAEGMLNLDFVHAIAPDQVFLVANDRLGAIHQTLATTWAAIYGGRPIDRIVLNQTHHNPDASQMGNAKQIASYRNVPPISELAFGATHHDLSFLPHPSSL